MFITFLKDVTMVQIWMRRSVFGLVTLMASLIGPVMSRADIIGTSGAIDVLSSAPSSVKKNALISDTAVFAFSESAGLTLAGDVQVNILDAGTYKSGASLTPGSVAAGTTVDSYFLHADADSNGSIYVGSVTFSTSILGVIVLSSELSASDAMLALPARCIPRRTIPEAWN